MRYDCYTLVSSSELILQQVCSHSSGCILFRLKVKYKEDGRKEMSVNLYSLLPDTLDTQHAKELSDTRSEVGSSSRITWKCLRFTKQISDYPQTTEM